MAKMVGVQSTRSRSYLDSASAGEPLDYRRVYRQIRATPSMEGIPQLIDSMKQQAQTLHEAAERLQKI